MQTFEIDCLLELFCRPVQGVHSSLPTYKSGSGDCCATLLWLASKGMKSGEWLLVFVCKCQATHEYAFPQQGSKFWHMHWKSCLRSGENLTGTSMLELRFVGMLCCQNGLLPITHCPIVQLMAAPEHSEDTCVRAVSGQLVFVALDPSKYTWILQGFPTPFYAEKSPESTTVM